MDESGRYEVTLTNETPQPELLPQVDLLCLGSELSIINAPSDATFTWEDKPSYTLSTYNNAVTILKKAYPSFLIEADVAQNECKVHFQQNYILPDVLEEPDGVKISSSNDGQCKQPEFFFSIPSFSTETSQATYEWIFTTNNYPILEQDIGTTSASVLIDYPGDGTLLTVTATVIVKDLCGKKEFKYGKIIKYEEKCKKGGWELVVNPNPAHDEVFIDFWKEGTIKGENDDSETQIKLISAFEGIKYIATTTQKEGVNIPLYNVENGLYYVQVLTSDGVMTSKALVVQKE